VCLACVDGTTARAQNLQLLNQELLNREPAVKAPRCVALPVS
jgi:hypothetical protein